MEVQNELGVIVRFSQEASRYGFEIIEISDRYPDAIVEKNGIKYRAEFEFSAKNFVSHKHDIRQCDIIICWENDYPDCILPILELSQQDWGSIVLSLPDENKREIAYWKQRALTAERRAKAKQLKTSVPQPEQVDYSQTIFDLLNDGLMYGPTRMAEQVGCSKGTASKWISEWRTRQTQPNGNGKQ